MSIKRQLARGWRVLTQRASADAELNEELRHFYEEEIARLMASGRSRTEAERAARLNLGELGNVVEDVRAAGWESRIEAVLLDLRYALRGLRKNPGFTLVCVLTLALGIGTVTAIFGAIKPILLDPLPYPDSDRILTIADNRQGTPLDITFGTFVELQQRSRSFDALAALKVWQPTLTGVDEPERVDGQRVSADYFRVLGVAPFIGRDFMRSDDVLRGPNVVILSHRMWQRRFAGERGIIGRTITLNDAPYTVIGVLPADFENVLSPGADAWAPLQYDASLPSDGREWGHHLRLVGRLRGGVERTAAVRELDQIAQTPEPQFQRMSWADMSGGFLVSSLQQELTRGVRQALYVVIGAVLLLLLIACVNVTNLLLARGAQRQGELALRTALGAGRKRLIGQFVVETVLLALLGAVAGLGVARVGLRALIALSPPELPRVSAMRIDAGVFTFAFASASLVGLVIGVLVALHASRRRNGVQRHGNRITGGNQRTRRVLVVAQVALAVVLLVSGGLLLRSLQRLFAVDPGFNPEQLITMQVRASSRQFDSDQATRQFYADALAAVRAVPGVTAASFTSQLPLSGDVQSYGLQLESAPALDQQDDGSGLRFAVTPDYFRVMQIPLKRGRLLNEQDATDAPGAVVVNESFARWRFRGGDPLGQRIKVGSADQPWATIVGIVADVKHLSLAVTRENQVYLPTTQGFMADRVLTLVARVRGDPATLAAPIRNAIWSVNKDQPITQIVTMKELVTRSAAERRFTLIILDAFAVAALLLAAIGLYGILAATVNARTREIGVRTALGASRSSIQQLIVGHGFTLTAVGLMVGLVGAVAAARALRSLLFGISEFDGITYGGVILLMLAVCAVASWLPALRAARIQPSITLRTE